MIIKILNDVVWPSFNLVVLPNIRGYRYSARMGKIEIFFQIAINMEFAKKRAFAYYSISYCSIF